jgi:hypothetical protein
MDETVLRGQGTSGKTDNGKPPIPLQKTALAFTTQLPLKRERGSQSRVLAALCEKINEKGILSE